MSSVGIPSIRTNFAPFSTSSISPYRSTSPGSPLPTMTSQSRSCSISSASSHLSTFSSASDRSLSTSPGPATPCDILSRSPSFSHDSIYKPTLLSLKHPHLSSCHSHPPSPSFPSAHRYSPLSSFSRHHPYQTSQQYPQKQYYQSNHQDRSYPPSPSFRLPSPSLQREMFSTHSSRIHGDYHGSYHHQPRSPYNSSNQADYFQSRSPMYHNTYPVMISPKVEERESSCIRSVTQRPVSRSDRRVSSTMDDVEEYHSDYAPSMSHSPSLSHTGSSFSRESSTEHLGSMSEASTSMTSLVSSNSSTCSSNSSRTPVPTTTQLLLCPVCSRAFKPSKNQNCNLRRHLKNVHNMSPTIHPRKCKWDSLPDGRVKDDKDRKERTRKSKRLWARKFRLRRKVEEAAVVLSMLSQAV